MNSLRARFAGLDLQARITLSLVVGSLAISSLIAVISFGYFRYQLLEQATGTLEATARLEQREIELAIDGVLAQVESLAANTVTANALADSAGRETYLVPLFANMKFPLPGVSVVLTDYRGKPIVQSGPSPIGSLDPEKLAGQLQERPAPRAYVSRSVQGKLILTTTMPVFYRLSGNVEGMVAVGIPLDALVAARSPNGHPPGDPDTMRRIDAGPGLAIGPAPNSTMLSMRVPVRLGVAPENAPLFLSVMLDRAEILRSMDRVIILYLAGGLAIISVVVVLSRQAARSLSAPVRHLSAAAEEIATTGRPSATPLRSGPDEFGRLAGAFNRMVERLGESYAVLESRVEERTAALQRSEARLRYVMDATGAGIWDWNIKTGRVTHNPTWCELLGLDMTYLDHPMSIFVDVLHPDDRDDALAHVDRCLKDGTPYRHEHRMRRPDGSIVWVLDRGAVVERDADGTPTRMVGSISDITESRAGQARLQDRTEQLNAIFTLSPDGFISFDKELKVKYVSPAIHKMLGFAEDELVGLAEADLLAKIAALCDGSGIGDLTSLLRPDEQPSSENRMLIELAQPGKRVLEVGLRRSRAETVSQILYFRDVTHETEVDRMKSEFLSTAAHELRTPMASVYGFSELLLNQEFDEETRRDVLTTIFRQSELMASIINELLDLARIEARRGKDFVIERIDVGPFVQSVAAGYKPPGGRSAPAIGLPDNSPVVRGDRKKLQQAVTNVLSNAYKYSPEGGGIELDVIVPPADSPTEIGLRITDHGIGMTPAQCQRVGERFFRVDTSGKIPGTGLGMAIVREIVALHGGRLEISSVSGQGTQVTLWMPTR